MHDEPVHRRKKRGVFNFVGEVGKILFDTMDDKMQFTTPIKYHDWKENS